MSYTAVEVKDLSYKYPESNKGLNKVSFTIKSGESVALVGTNGAGKSTILMMLTGLLLSKNGEVNIEDIHVSKKTLPEIRGKIGFVFQNPEDQLFMTTVYDDVAFAPRNYKLPEEDVHKKVMNALNKVGGEFLKDRKPYKLSGGEKHISAIASALSMEPSILIMDEPTSSLDPRARRRIINLLNDFNETKIIATHDLDMVLETCERTIIVKDGEIVYDGATEGILTDEKQLREFGLELPISFQKIQFKFQNSNL